MATWDGKSLHTTYAMLAVPLQKLHEAGFTYWIRFDTQPLDPAQPRDFLLRVNTWQNTQVIPLHEGARLWLMLNLEDFDAHP